MSRKIKAAALGLATLALAGALSEASARPRYGYRGGYGYHRGGIGSGAAVAGAALGIAGLAAGAIAANRYYNGYPAYDYGAGYGGYYGYDYHPNYGYYGPY